MLLSKFVPQGLAARFVLLLVTALVAAYAVAIILLLSENRRFANEVQDDRQVERIITLVKALESVDPALWETINGDEPSRLVQAQVGRRPIIEASNTNQRARRVDAALSEALPGHEIYAALVTRQAQRQILRQSQNQNKRQKPLGASKLIDEKEADTKQIENGVLAISVRLKNSNGVNSSKWLNSVSSTQARGFGPGLQILLIGLALSLASLLAVGLLFIRQLVKPLSALAKAADAAGKGDRTAKVPLEGAREFRLAGAAFNEMQTKIAQFDAERMRTLAAVGHDLRTPITSLRIRAEMLDDETVRGAFVATLDDMTIMADGLVSYAKSGQETEPAQDIILAHFLERLCNERGATLVIKQHANLKASPVLLARAIGNLIDNALRYAGSATVFLEASASELRIIIEDNGLGIAPNRIEAMFEPFVRGDDSRSAETGGAGLGLSIARTLIVAQGGTLGLENKAEGGLRAIAAFPVKK